MSQSHRVPNLYLNSDISDAHCNNEYALPATNQAYRETVQMEIYFIPEKETSLHTPASSSYLGGKYMFRRNILNSLWCYT